MHWCGVDQWVIVSMYYCITISVHGVSMLWVYTVFANGEPFLTRNSTCVMKNICRFRQIIPQQHKLPWKWSISSNLSAISTNSPKLVCTVFLMSGRTQLWTPLHTPAYYAIRGFEESCVVLVMARRLAPLWRPSQIIGFNYDVAWNQADILT